MKRATELERIQNAPGTLPGQPGARNAPPNATKNLIDMAEDLWDMEQRAVLDNETVAQRKTREAQEALDLEIARENNLKRRPRESHMKALKDHFTKDPPPDPPIAGP